jgi:uncharacterized membrane protein YeaQ/YmgE (transglycosylase-associated protein family)
MVKVVVAPTQETPAFVKVGVTVMVPVIGAVVVLVATKLGMPVASPTLEAARPITGLLFVQVYVVVPTVFTVEKVTAAVLPPLQTISSAIASTSAVGFTVMVKISAAPAQVLTPSEYVGVTVMVAVIGAVVVLVATKLGIPVASPALEAAKPIAGVSFVQVYVVVPTVFTVEKVTAAVLPPLQTTSFAIAFT